MHAMLLSVPALRMPLRQPANTQLRSQPLMGGAAPYPYNFISVEPTYTINEPEAVQQIMVDYVSRSKPEPGLCYCYCGFSTTRSKPDSSVVGAYSTTSGF